MSTKPLSFEEATRRVDAINRAIHSGAKTLREAVKEAARELNLNSSTLHNSLGGILRAHDLEPVDIPRRIETPPGLIFPDFPTNEPPIEDLLSHLEKGSERALKAAAARKWFTIQAPENLPIAWNWFGDPHLGESTNWKLLRRDVEIVRSTPGMYGANIYYYLAYAHRHGYGLADHPGSREHQGPLRVGRTMVTLSGGDMGGEVVDGTGWPINEIKEFGTLMYRRVSETQAVFAGEVDV